MFSNIPYIYSCAASNATRVYFVKQTVSVDSKGVCRTINKYTGWRVFHNIPKQFRLRLLSNIWFLFVAVGKMVYRLLEADLVRGYSQLST